MPYVQILIVDDNELNLQIAEGLMEPLQMKIDCVLSGREAIAAVQAKEYDLIFLDHMMPELDGVETLRRIRKLPGERFGRLPVVALTANAVNGAREMFLKEGFSDFLSKPVDISELNEILVKWLGAVNAERSADGNEV